MRRGDGEPIPPGDFMPRGMCQPPVNTVQLIEALDVEELRRAVRVMVIWAPEVFELALQRAVSQYREDAAAYRRQRAAGGARCAKCHAEPCKDGSPFGARCLDICHEALEFDHCCMICATPEEARALGFRVVPGGAS